MKKVLLILLIPLLLFGATKYYLPVQIESSNGRPIRDATVAIYDSTGTVKKADCYWHTSGIYYFTTSLPAGKYDIKIYTSGEWITLFDDIQIIPNILTAQSDVVHDSLLAHNVSQTNLKVNGYGSGYGIDSVGVYQHLKFLQVYTPEEFGAKGDGTTDDYEALQEAIDKINTEGGILRLGEKTYKFTQKLILSPNTSIRDKGIIIIGSGVKRTKLKYIGNGVALEIKHPAGGTNRAYRNVLKNFTLEGTTTAIDTGISFSKVSKTILEDVMIDSFSIGEIIFNSELITHINVSVVNSNIDVYVYGNSNANIWQNCDVGWADSTGFYFKGSLGNSIIVPDAGLSNIFIYADSSAVVNLYGGNLESCDKFIRVGHNATVNVYGARFLKGSKSNSLIGYLSGVGSLNFYNIDWADWNSSDSLVVRESYLGDVKLFGLHYKEYLYVYDKYEDTKFPLGLGWHVSSYRLASKNIEMYRSLIATTYGNDTYTDGFWFGQQITDNVIYNNPLHKWNDWRFSTNGGENNSSSEIERGRVYQGYIDFTSNTGDSTIVTVYTDTLGIDEFKFIDAGVVMKRESGGIINAYATADYYSIDLTKGKVNFIVWHPSPYNTGGLALRLYYNITVKAKKTGTW